ncbi:MAG: hypothetical protein ACXAD7_24190, partial [Candidatus Kariarchaeaceae archaeon]
MIKAQYTSHSKKVAVFSKIGVLLILLVMPSLTLVNAVNADNTMSNNKDDDIANSEVSYDTKPSINRNKYSELSPRESSPTGNDNNNLASIKARSNGGGSSAF